MPSSIGRAVSSEAMSSCVTTSTDPTGKRSHVLPVVEEGKPSSEPTLNESENAGLACNEEASLPKDKIDLQVMVEQCKMECAEVG